MKKNHRQAENALTIPFNVLTAILLGIIFLLMSYIFSNYVVVAPVQHSPVSAPPESVMEYHTSMTFAL